MDPESHLYSLRLTFSPVKSEDLNATFLLLLANAQGEQELSLRVGADAPPPSPASAPQPASEGNDELPAAAGGTGSSDDSVDNGKDEWSAVPEIGRRRGRRLPG